VIVALAGEGPTDVAAARRLVEHAGHSVHREFSLAGKSQLDRRLTGFNNAARFSPWLVLRDLDHDAACAPELIAQLLPNRAELMLFRVAVRAVESWLLADAEAFAAFFHLPPESMPTQPDELPNPKETILDIIANASTTSIRKLMLPGGKARKVGPGYSATLIEFISAHWDVGRAAPRSRSLERCLAALSPA
jgi:hypothetical protein